MIDLENIGGVEEEEEEKISSSDEFLDVLDSEDDDLREFQITK